MLHCVYKKEVPNGLWHLVSVSVSAEIVIKDKETVLKAALESGNQEVEVKIKTFDSIWETPETLKILEENDKLLYN